MATIIPFPTTAARNESAEPWERSPKLAVGGYWATCESCKNKCFRAGHWFIACVEHSKYGTPWKGDGTRHD